MPAELRFRAMGTDAHVVVTGDERLLAVARARIEDLERRWSRFLPSSEVSRLGTAGGRPAVVSPDTLTLVRACATAWAATDGRFDPTIRQALVALGYDRSFPLLADQPARHGARGPAVGPAPGMAGVEVDERSSTVRFPIGVGLDAGGLGKGLAADLVVAELQSLGAHGAMVNLGGDLAVDGAPPEGEAWVVRVDDPFEPARELTRVALVRGGMATSSTLGRRWVVDGVPLHHVLDPSTGLPVPEDQVAATVVAGQAWWAEALATSLLVGGPTTPLPSASALIVRRSGGVARLGEDPSMFATEADGAVLAS